MNIYFSFSQYHSVEYFLIRKIMRYHFHERRFQRKYFQIQPPESLFIEIIFNFLPNFLNVLKDSSLWKMNKIHVNLKKSSTITNSYLFPSKLSVLVWSNKYLCSSPRTLYVITAFLGWKLDLVCFPLMQASHTLSLLNLMFGNTLTRLCLDSLDKVFMLRWSTLLCHSHL